jgi:hypothetical protein
MSGVTRHLASIIMSAARPHAREAHGLALLDQSPDYHVDCPGEGTSHLQAWHTDLEATMVECKLQKWKLV